MYRYTYKNMARVLLFTCLLINTAMAEQASADTTLNMQWLLQQVRKHPDLIAARERRIGQMFLADGLQKPIYNPNLDTEYEKEGSDRNYSVGISQTFDRNNKRQSRSLKADSLRISAKQQYELALQEKASQALRTYNEWQAISKAAQLAIEQEAQLAHLLEIIKNRQSYGDLGQLDAELAYLSLSQGYGRSANIIAKKRKIESQLTELLPDWNKQTIELSIFSDSDLDAMNSQQNIDRHPQVMAAKAKWQMLQADTEIARKQKKADPSFGINVGKVANDNLLSLSFSMPLNLRNNFSAQYKAAIQAESAAQSNYLAIRRKQQLLIDASAAALNAYRLRHEKWQTLMQGRDKNSENLLQKQWNIGDISTTEYLLTLQQRTESLLAGIDLEKEYQAAIIQLLTDTAQLGINPTSEKNK